MRSCVAIAVAVMLTAATPVRWQVPRTPDGKPDLQGIWTNMTATPLQRPREFAGRTHFTTAEAAEYERTWLKRLIDDEDEIDRMGADLNEIYLDDRRLTPDLRTSLIVDPPDGRLPPLIKAAVAPPTSSALRRSP